MSPELFFPKEFNLKDDRPTKHSDCYALGMVMYEVLSGKKPFSGYNRYDIIVRIHKGKRPVRPRGDKVGDEIWNMLEQCWKRNPGDRPRVEDVLDCLEASRSWTSPQTVADRPTTDSSTRNLDSSSEESANSGSPLVTQSHSLRTSLSKGNSGHKTSTSTRSLTHL
jgi:hypothetical protein